MIGSLSLRRTNGLSESGAGVGRAQRESRAERGRTRGGRSYRPGYAGGERWTAAIREGQSCSPSARPSHGPGEAELCGPGPSGSLVALSALDWPMRQPPGSGPCITWCPGWSPGPASPGCAPASPCCPWCPTEASRHLSAPGRQRGARQCISGLRDFGG